MKRRVFLLRTGAAVTVVLMGSVACWYISDDPATGVMTPFIQDFLSEEDLSNIIQDYLEDHEGTFDLKADSIAAPRTEIKQDFISRNTCICDGWVLSETEVQYLIQRQQNGPDS